MINLNNEEYKTKEFTPFNGGEAGIAMNVNFNVVRKTAEDKPNAPDYKLIFTDDDGGQVNRSFWYVDEDAIKKNENAIVNQGKTIVHLWHAAKGKSADIPQFKNPVEMLDMTMAMLRDETRLKVNVAVDYGTKDYHKSFLEVKFFVPFMEIDVDETKLFLSKSAMTSRNTPDDTDSVFVFDKEDSAKDSSKEVNW